MGINAKDACEADFHSQLAVFALRLRSRTSAHVLLFYAALALGIVGETFLDLLQKGKHWEENWCGWNILMLV